MYCSRLDHLLKLRSKLNCVSKYVLGNTQFRIIVTEKNMIPNWTVSTTRSKGAYVHNRRLQFMSTKQTNQRHSVRPPSITHLTYFFLSKISYSGHAE